MTRARRAVLLALLASACGRINYEVLDASGGDAGRFDSGGVDASMLDAGSTDAGVFDGSIPVGLIHQYQLEGNYADDLGGPDLVPSGGALVAGGYQFGPNQGVSVTGAIPDSVYTVDFLFSFDTLDSWKKILDYKNLTTDEGLYTFGDALQFVIVAGSDFATSRALFTVDTQRQVTITRDAAGNVNGFVDRVQQISFVDSANVATLTAPGAVAHFFIDDTATGMGEAAGGIVRRIRIWDVALTATEIPP